MRVALVTGATGLLGFHIAERLRADGWRVRALVRDLSRGVWLGDAGVELRSGDVLDLPSFSEAASGCDALFHAAAVVSTRGGWEAYRTPNIEGTRNAVAAAARAGARLLQVSSVAVYGPLARYAHGEGGIDESLPLAPLPEGAWYARSKRESEQIALDAHRRGELWATAIRPTVVYGRHDRQFVPRVARLVKLGVLPVINGGRPELSLVHAANVADAAVRAITHDGAGGQAYLVANDFPVTSAELFHWAAAALGRRVRLVSVPQSLARRGMATVTSSLRLSGGGAMAQFTASAVDFVSRGNPFSSALTRRELGWAPTVRPAEGIPDAFQWWAREAEYPGAAH